MFGVQHALCHWLDTVETAWPLRAWCAVLASQAAARSLVDGEFSTLPVISTAFPTLLAFMA